MGETGVSNYELLVTRIVYTMYKLLCRLRGPGFRACAGLYFCVVTVPVPTPGTGVSGFWRSDAAAASP